LNLLDVQKMIDIQEIMQELTEEKKTELLQELEDHRELKQKGVRVSSISAAQDMRFTMQRLTQEVNTKYAYYRLIILTLKNEGRQSCFSHGRANLLFHNKRRCA